MESHQERPEQNKPQNLETPTYFLKLRDQIETKTNSFKINDTRHHMGRRSQSDRPPFIVVLLVKPPDRFKFCKKKKTLNYDKLNTINRISSRLRQTTSGAWFFVSSESRRTCFTGMLTTLVYSVKDLYSRPMTMRVRNSTRRGTLNTLMLNTQQRSRRFDNGSIAPSLHEVRP